MPDGDGRGSRQGKFGRGLGPGRGKFKETGCGRSRLLRTNNTKVSLRRNLRR